MKKNGVSLGYLAMLKCISKTLKYSYVFLLQKISEIVHQHQKNGKMWKKN